MGPVSSGTTAVEGAIAFAVPAASPAISVVDPPAAPALPAMELGGGCGGNGGAPRSMGTPGRDHWGDAMFCLLGGGGLKGGQVIGSTDRLGMRPNSRPVTPCNIHATVYRVLGIDPKLQLLDPSGRPVNVLEQPEPIGELL